MSKKSHLLCVDDDLKIIELLNIYLKGKGFNVTRYFVAGRSVQRRYQEVVKNSRAQ